MSAIFFTAGRQSQLLSYCEEWIQLMDIPLLHIKNQLRPCFYWVLVEFHLSTNANAVIWLADSVQWLGVLHKIEIFLVSPKFEKWLSRVHNCKCQIDNSLRAISL